MPVPSKSTGPLSRLTPALPAHRSPLMDFPSTTTLSASFAARDTAALAPPPMSVAPISRRPSSREAILDAAEAVVSADGAAHLTLDAVAERAGISKGGLLYNFSTKEALLEAMLDRHMRRFEAMQIQARETLPPGPGRELKALVLSANSPCPQRDKTSGCGTLAALANNPRLLEPVRAAHRRRLERLTASTTDSAALPFARTAAISLAVDGLCLLEVLQISPYSADERQQVIDDLLHLVDETTLSAVTRSDS